MRDHYNAPKLIARLPRADEKRQAVGRVFAGRVERGRRNCFIHTVSPPHGNELAQVSTSASYSVFDSSPVLGAGAIRGASASMFRALSQVPALRRTGLRGSAGASADEAGAMNEESFRSAVCGELIGVQFFDDPHGS